MLKNTKIRSYEVQRVNEYISLSARSCDIQAVKWQGFVRRKRYKTRAPPPLRSHASSSFSHLFFRVSERFFSLKRLSFSFPLMKSRLLISSLNPLYTHFISSQFPLNPGIILLIKYLHFLSLTVISSKKRH
jgi:hypothetical protein